MNSANTSNPNSNPAAPLSADVIIIGGGPGGYTAAIRAAQLGLETILVEKRSTLGGTCLNIGCIPSKALLESSELFETIREHAAEHGIAAGAELRLPEMMARKDRIVKGLADGIQFLMKKNKIKVIEGAGRLEGARRVRVEMKESSGNAGAGASGGADGNAGGLAQGSGAGAISSGGAVGGGGGGFVLEARRGVILATGSEPAALPSLPFDGERIISSTEALALGRVPARLLVIGAGAIGLELGSVWRRLGAKVTILEWLPRAAPFADIEVSKVLQRSLARQGLEFHFNVQVTGAERLGDGVRVTCKNQSGADESYEADVVLACVGRRPFTAGLGLETAGIRPGAGGRIPVDAKFQTSAPGVYAIGDLIEGPMLAHKAAEEGAAAAEIIAGKPGHVNTQTIPNVIYTEPELAQVGLTEEQAREQGHELRMGIFHFKANARARTLGATDGLAKIVASAKTGKILGVHIVGPRASELISEAVVALEYSASTEDLAGICHPHPTLSEALKEAALAAEGRAIHS